MASPISTIEYKHHRTQRRCTQQPIHYDNGVAVFRGFYSGLLVRENEMIYVGPVIPQATECYVDEGNKARQASVRMFDEAEANCNTCAYLERVPFKKDISGLMPGKCKNPDADMSVHPYPPIEGIMKFAPEDWQGMPCWKGR